MTSNVYMNADTGKELGYRNPPMGGKGNQVSRETVGCILTGGRETNWKSWSERKPPAYRIRFRAVRSGSKFQRRNILLATFEILPLVSVVSIT